MWKLFFFSKRRSRCGCPFSHCAKGMTIIRGGYTSCRSAKGKEAVVVSRAEDVNQLPFGIPELWYFDFDTSKAQTAGFEFRQLNESMPKLIREIAVCS